MTNRPPSSPISAAAGTLAAAKKNRREHNDTDHHFALRIAFAPVTRCASGFNDRDVAVDDFARSAGPPDDAGKRAVDLKRPTAELRPALGTKFGTGRLGGAGICSLWGAYWFGV